MKCRNCGSDVDKKWGYCPKCGTPVVDFFMNFSDIFRRVHDMENEMEKTFQKNLEVLDISPMFRVPKKGSGFSVKIITRNNEKPQVSVKTFGNIDKERLEKEIYDQYGLKKGHKQEEEKQEKEKLVLPEPKITEEPETVIKRFGNRVVVAISLPGVKSQEDVKINDLESSIEVRAMVGEKAYFKILTKPQNTKIIDKRFEKERLILEIA